MFLWAITFLIIAIMAGTLAGIGGPWAFLNQISFILFLILFVVSLIWEVEKPIHYKHHGRRR